MNPIQHTYTPTTGDSAQRVELPAQQVQAGRSPSSSQGPAASGAGAGDTVSISESARQLLQTGASQGASASTQRLSSLRQAIASGSYSVDARQIAQGLLRDSRALAQAGAGNSGGGA
jgi:flagellar biosynthesis anti-sigma factor FlgM